MTDHYAALASASDRAAEAIVNLTHENTISVHRFFVATFERLAADLAAQPGGFHYLPGIELCKDVVENSLKVALERQQKCQDEALRKQLGLDE